MAAKNIGLNSKQTLIDVKLDFSQVILHGFFMLSSNMMISHHFIVKQIAQNRKSKMAAKFIGVNSKHTLLHVELNFSLVFQDEICMLSSNMMRSSHCLVKGRSYLEPKIQDGRLRRTKSQQTDLLSCLIELSFAILHGFSR